ncbi:hypothetical protein GBA52_028854 [Prunus armeniaca]|nr:hypothetical protein GBA52_028854 [Prunus armeniaca]
MVTKRRRLLELSSTVTNEGLQRSAPCVNSQPPASFSSAISHNQMFSQTQIQTHLCLTANINYHLSLCPSSPKQYETSLPLSLVPSSLPCNIDPSLAYTDVATSGSFSQWFSKVLFQLAAIL